MKPSTRAKYKVQKFTKTLDKRLQKIGITPAEFAQKMGMHRMTIYRWINGRTVMNLPSYFKALDVLQEEEAKVFNQKTI